MLEVGFQVKKELAILLHLHLYPVVLVDHHMKLLKANMLQNLQAEKGENVKKLNEEKKGEKEKVKIEKIQKN